ncbi:MAG: sterol carrier protein domain-containing protein [Chloroflexia bacterium]
MGGKFAAGSASRMGQWFGGGACRWSALTAWRSRGVSFGGHSVRAATPDVRGRTRGRLRLSVLYASTQPVSRRNGYEQAGSVLHYKVPISSISLRTLSPDERAMVVLPIEPDDHGALKALYNERARQTSGNLDRNDHMWGRVFHSEDALLSGYLVLRDGAPEGYVFYTQRREGNHRDLNTRDLVALTPQAARKLLSFLAGHRSTVDRLSWTGSAADPWMVHVGDPNIHTDWFEHWLLRIVDMRTALEARGYPEGVEAELHLDISDDVLPWNNGRFVLAVSGGRGAVREGGEGRLKLDVRGLSQLYTGYLSAQELQMTGYIEGDGRDLSRADAVFAGPTPWMPDEF